MKELYQYLEVAEHRISERFTGERKEIAVFFFAFFASFLMIMAAFGVVMYDLSIPRVNAGFGDLDGDGLTDTQEQTDFFLFGKPELEDSYSDQEVIHRQFDMKLIRDENNPSWLKVAVNDALNGEFGQLNPLPLGNYQLQIFGKGKIQMTSGGFYTDEEMAEKEKEHEVLLNSIDIDFYINGAQVPFVGEEREWRHQVLTPGSDEIGPTIEREFFISREYQNIQADTVHVGLNSIAWTGNFRTLFPHIYTQKISIVSSFATILRQGGLNIMAPDSDGDGLTDFEEARLDRCPLKTDLDRDGLDDFEEVNVQNTDPTNRDTDYDGLRDRIELGVTNQQMLSPLTPFDDNPSPGSLFERRGRDMNPNFVNNPNNWIDNSCPQVAPAKEPTNQDTDGDGLPDGCIDGWIYDWTEDEWLEDGYTNGLHDFWEGEDLDLDGELDNGAWRAAVNPGETDPFVMDTDGDLLDDGWETWYVVDPTDNTPPNDGTGDFDEADTTFEYWHPNDVVNGANRNWNGDGVLNRVEYVAGTSPRCADTDYDSVGDKDEIQDLAANGEGVIFRTNVENGARSPKDYGVEALNRYEWLTYYDHDGIRMNREMVEYGYLGRSVEEIGSNAEPLEGSELHGLDYIHFFDSTSWVVLDEDEEEISVYRLEEQDNGEMAYSVITYSSAMSQDQAPTSCNVLDGYRFKEIYWIDPLRKNTDGTFYGNFFNNEDSVEDALESYDKDTDGDGLSNARDIDSDQDGIQDSQEGVIWGVWDWDLDQDGDPNWIDDDSDGDGVYDSVEILERHQQMKEKTHVLDFYTSPYKMDSDGDGLLDGYSVSIDKDPSDEHYKYFMDSKWDLVYEEVPSVNKVVFIGEKEPTLDTDPCNPDTDGDMLYDGNTKVGLDGYVHLGEMDSSIDTNPKDSDTDDDSVLDGWEVYGWPVTIVAPDGTERKIIGTSDPKNMINGEPAGASADTDGDGLPDKYEYMWTDGDNRDTDGDKIEDGKEDYNNNNVYDKGQEPSPVMMDTDGDGLVDGYYDYNGNDDKDWWEGEDLDYDGHDPGNWFTDETKAYDKDTDGDGVPDGLEVKLVYFRTNADSSDKLYEDGDWIALFIQTSSGVNNGHFIEWLVVFEYDSYTNLDSDFEAYSLYGVDRKDKWDHQIYIDMDADYSTETDPTVYIHKGGASNQYAKFFVYATDPPTYVDDIAPVWKYRDQERYIRPISNPNNDDTDGDQLKDYDEIISMCKCSVYGLTYLDTDMDSIPSANRLCPWDTDSDNDGVNDYKDPTGTHSSLFKDDIDADGLPCALDKNSDGDTYTLDSTDTKPTDPDDDDDDDLIPDPFEDAVDTNLKTKQDYDGDGIIDGREVSWDKDQDDDGKINAKDPDSDGDRLLDGPTVELKETDPKFVSWTKSYDDGGHYILYEFSRVDANDDTWYKVLGEDQNGNGDLDDDETDPYHWDTDLDRVPDGMMLIDGMWYGEAKWGSDPLSEHSDTDGISDTDETFGFFTYDEILPGAQLDSDMTLLSRPKDTQVWKVYNKYGRDNSGDSVNFFVMEPGRYRVEVLIAAGKAVVGNTQADNAQVEIWNDIPGGGIFTKTIYNRDDPSSPRPELNEPPYEQVNGWMDENWRALTGYCYKVVWEFIEPVSDGSSSPKMYTIGFYETTPTTTTDYSEYFYYILGDVLIKKQGLNPADTDTDRDERDDNIEITTPPKTYPGVADSDRDGYTDKEEIDEYLLPTRYDTDFDGIADSDDTDPLSYFRIKWRNTYSPGMLKITDEMHIVWTKNEEGGWSSPHTEGDFQDQVNDMLRTDGFWMYNNLHSEEGEDWSDPNWRGENREVKHFSWCGGQVEYKRFHDTRTGSYTNVIPKPSPFYSTGVDVLAKKDISQEVIIQFSISASEDIGADNDKFFMILLYNIYPALKRQRDGGYWTYYYTFNDPKLEKDGVAVCGRLDGGDLRTNRNAYQAVIKIPPYAAQPTDVNEDNIGKLHLALTILYFYHPGDCSDEEAMKNPCNFRPIDTDKASLRIGGINTKATDYNLQLHAPQSSEKSDVEFLEEARNYIDGLDLGTIQSGPWHLQFVDSNGDAQSYKTVVLNQYAGHDCSPYYDDVENMKYNADPDNPEDLDFVIIITKDENDHLKMTSDDIGWKAKWSEVYRKTHLEGPDVPGPDDRIHSDPEDNLPKAIDWFHGSARQKFYIVQDLSLIDKGVRINLVDQVFERNYGVGTKKPGSNHEFYGKLNECRWREKGVEKTHFVKDEYGSDIRKPLKTDTIKRTVLKDADIEGYTFHPHLEGSKVVCNFLKQDHTRKIHDDSINNILKPDGKNQMVRKYVGHSTSILMIVNDGLTCVVLLEEGDYIGAVFAGAQTAADVYYIYAHFKIGTWNGVSKVSKSLKPLKAAAMYIEPAICGIEAVTSFHDGKDFHGWAMVEKAIASAAIAITIQVLIYCIPIVGQIIALIDLCMYLGSFLASSTDHCKRPFGLSDCILWLYSCIPGVTAKSFMEEGYQYICEEIFQVVIDLQNEYGDTLMIVLIYPPAPDD